jgi:phosphate transport system protein
MPPFRTAEDERALPLRLDYAARLDRLDADITSAATSLLEVFPTLVRSLIDADRAALPELHATCSDAHHRTRDVEEDGFVLLALEAPVAGDLRRLVAILRMVHHVERSAKMMHHIADCAERLDTRLLPGEVRSQLHDLADHSMAVFRDGLAAWRSRDALAVHELNRADADVDGLRTALLTRAHDLDERPESIVTLGLLALYFERLADHGVVFAQHATFAVTGERIEVAE